MFEDLELPDLERKRLRQIESSASSVRKGSAAKASACVWTRNARRVRASSARKLRSAHRPGCSAAGALSLSRRRSTLPPHGHRHAQGIQRRRALHHGHFRLHGYDEEISGAQLLLPALSVSLHALSKRRDRLHRAPHRGARGHRGRILSQGRVRRHFYLVRLQQGAGNHRGSATTRRSGTFTCFTAPTATTSSRTTQPR